MNHSKIHLLKLGRSAMKLIASGRQTVEGRLTSKRLHAIEVDDILSFNEGALLVRVTRITNYSTFREMVCAETPAALGEKADDIEAAIRSYRKIYWYPDAEKKGCIAFAIQLCDMSLSQTPTQTHF